MAIATGPLVTTCIQHTGMGILIRAAYFAQHVFQALQVSVTIPRLHMAACCTWCKLLSPPAQPHSCTAEWLGIQHAGMRISSRFIVEDLHFGLALQAAEAVPEVHLAAHYTWCSSCVRPHTTYNSCDAHADLTPSLAAIRGVEALRSGGAQQSDDA